MTGYTMTIDQTIWLPVLATAIGSVLTALLYKSLIQARVKSLIADTYDHLVKTLSEQVLTLQSRVDHLTERLDMMMARELQHMEQITLLTKERNLLQMEIIERDKIIQGLQREIMKK